MKRNVSCFLCFIVALSFDGCNSGETKKTIPMLTHRYNVLPQKEVTFVYQKLLLFLYPISYILRINYNKVTEL